MGCAASPLARDFSLGVNDHLLVSAYARCASAESEPAVACPASEGASRDDLPLRGGLGARVTFTGTALDIGPRSRYIRLSISLP